MENDPRCDAEPSEGVERLRHALMNRLTVVVGYAQMIASRSDLDPETRCRADQILSQANECVRIMELWTGDESISEVFVPDVPGRASSADRTSPTVVLRHGEGASPEICGRVLVVDDEVIIRTLARHVLMSAYDVATCETAEEALSLIMVTDFDAVLVDLNLEGAIGGRGLYETLRIQHPEVASRVVFMSGGVVGPDEIRFLEESGRPYLQKPFNIDELRTLVRTVMYCASTSHRAP